MHAILEGLVTTSNADQTVNVSPMGPRVTPDLSSFVLRPFQTSRTYQNLKRHGEGVLHVTDDALMLAQAAINQLPQTPDVRACTVVSGSRLTNCCRWYEFRVAELDDSQERTNIECEVVSKGLEREFFGFNRGKHAIVEIAILATRVGIIPDEEVRDGLRRWSVLVEKTGAEAEHEALGLLSRYIEQSLLATANGRD